MPMTSFKDSRWVLITIKIQAIFLIRLPSFWINYRLLLYETKTGLES